MKLKIFSLFFFLTAIFFSCKKDDQLPIPEPPAPILSKVIVDNK